MKCKQCGNEINAGAKFCPICGEKVNEEIYCSNCGEILPEGTKFCSSCGKLVSEEDTTMELSDNYGKETTINNEIPESKHVKRTLETFKAELQELGDRDSKSKAVVTALGTKIFYKYFYTYLRYDEKLLAVRNIQSKFLFARYRKEFVALTDKRVIKFEKMQYFKPRIESFYYEEIRGMKSDEPSNAVSGTFIGEKVCISNWDGRQIDMRMVGKGAAKEFEACAMQEKQNHGETLPKGTLQKDTGHLYKKGKKKIVIIVGAVVIALAVLMFLGGSGTGTELSDYIPLARADVMEFIEKNGIEEILEDTMYGNDDLSITLNDNGNIDSLIIETPKYSLYGMKVGNEFSLEKDGKILTGHNYGYLGDFNNRMVYGTDNNNEKLDDDHMIGITLDPSGVITKLEYISANPQEFLNEGIETSEGSEEAENDGSTDYLASESDKRDLTDGEIAEMSDYEKLAVMYEIAARHGATFLNVEDGAEWQKYFESKKWYIPSVPIEDMEDGVFNTYEMNNIIKISESITGTETANRDNMILPDSDRMYYSETDLADLSKEQLRLARNEIYARHGRKFETEDLNQYFSSQSWYNGYLSADEFDDSILNGYEKANLDLIKSIESRIQSESIGAPDYIEGSSTQLGTKNISNKQYISSDKVMEIWEGEDGTHIGFFIKEDWVWEGTVSRYQVLPNGGLGLVVEGYNYITEDNDYLTVEWTTMADKDTPKVDFEFGSPQIGGSYSIQ